jgi:hypothetical protein
MDDLLKKLQEDAKTVLNILNDNNNPHVQRICTYDINTVLLELIVCIKNTANTMPLS